MKRLIRFILLTLGYVIAVGRVMVRLGKAKRQMVVFGSVFAIAALVVGATPPTPSVAAAPTLGLSCKFWHNSNNSDTTQYFGEATSSATWGDADNVNFADSSTPTGDCSASATDLSTSWSMSQYYNADNTIKASKVADVGTLNYYTVLFQGYLKPNITNSNLYIRLVSDDASYIWTGANALSGWTRGNATAKHPGLHGTTNGVITSGTINVTSGFYYPIRILFGELGGGDEVTFSYSTNSGSTWTGVPSSWLYNQGTSVVNDQAAPSTPGTPSLTAGTDSGASSTDGITSNTSPILQGTAEANSTVTIYSNSTNSNSGGTQVATATANGLGNYTYTLSLNSSTDAYFYVTATDAIGYVSNPSATFRVRANKINIIRGSAGASSGNTLATQPQISLTDGGTAQVTLTNSLGAVANGVVSPVAGSVTFSGVTVTYDAATLAGSTMTYTATGYFSATETLSAIPAAITVATGTTTSGTSFLSNTLYSTNSGTVTLTPTDLLTQMSGASATTNLYSVGAITVSNAVSSTYAGKALKFATTGGVTFNGVVTTSNAAITVLANADNGSGANAGNIVIGSSGGLTSGGGAVVLAGGDWTATTGYARGTATVSTGDNAGVFIQGTISTAGGAFTANGLLGTSSSDSAGFYLGAGGKIQAAGGDINISGLIDSTSSSSGGTFRAVRLGAANGTPFVEVTTSNSGVINITGKTSKASAFEQAVLFENATVTAANGAVTIVADTFTGAANGFVFATGDSTVSTTGTGNVVIRSPQWTTGGDSYTNAIFASGGDLNVTAPAITIPKSWTCAGSLYVNAHGGDLNINGNLTVSGSTKTATLKTSGNIVLGAYKIQTKLGSLWLWSDIDANGGGIKTAAGSTISTDGGDVMISGGSSTTSGLTSTWAKGNSSTDDYGVSLGGVLNAAGGNITIRGEESATVVAGAIDRAGVLFNKSSSTTTAGTGTITIDGKVDSTAASDAKYHYGVVFGAGDAANLATVSAASGAISVRGDSSLNSGTNRRGILMNRSSITSTSGAITLDGLGGANSAGLAMILYGDNNSITSTTGAILLKGNAASGSSFFNGSASSGGGVTLNLSGVLVNAGSTFTLGGASAKVIESTSSENSFPGGLDLTGIAVSTNSRSVRVGKTTNSTAVTLASNWSVAGPIEVNGGNVSSSANLSTTGALGTIQISSNGTFTNSGSINTSSGNQSVVVKAQKLALTGTVNSGAGPTQLTGFANSRTIGLGLTSDSTDTLAISDAEVDLVTGGTLRIGDSSSGDITVAAPLSVASANVANVALRTAGNVTATNNSTITATNLGISAGGIVSLGGSNSISGNLAIVASGASGGSGVSIGGLSSLNPVSVDAIEPIYGLGKNITVSNAPAIGSTEVRYLNQTWSAPPVVTVKDSYGYTIASINSTKNNYITTLTDSGAPVLSGTAPVIDGGIQTFSSLKFISAIGSTAITFSTAGLAAGGTSSVTTGTYDVRASEPNSIVLTSNATTAIAGQTGFGITATLKDAGGNTLIGAHETDTVTVDVSDGDADVANNATLVSGYRPATVAGVADFSNLVLGGKVGVTYTLTFSVTFTDVNSVVQTKTATQQVTLTPGPATHLAIQTQAAGFVNRTNFTTQPVVAVKDAYENTVTSSSMSIDVSSDTGDLTGTLRVNVVNGVATFAGLGNAGLVGSKHLTFKKVGGGLAEATFDYVLTHGAATKLVVSRSALGAKSGQGFATQPKIQVQDPDGNLVTTGPASIAKIRISVSADAYDANAHTGVNLTGPTNFETVDAIAGEATFSGARLEGVVAGAYALKFVIVNTAGYDGLSATQNIALTAGSETHLSVVQQPTGIIAGAAFSPIVTVEILDAWNNRVLDVANTVTVKPTLVDDALASNVLDSSKTAVANASGLVTFTALTFTKAGSQFIQFTSSGLIATTSTSFTITNAQAHHLVWVTSPVGAKNDYAIKGAGNANPELEIRDQYENPVVNGASTSVDVTEPTSSSNVISISGGSARNTAGSARVIFSNLVLRAKVGSYTLRFTAANGSLPINGTHLDSSAAVAITFGDPSSLHLTRSAAGANVGAAFTTQPKLNIEDTAGNVVSDSTLAVSVSENESQILAGTQTKNAVAGSVDFTDSGLSLSGSVANGLTLKYALTYNSAEISTSQLIDLNPGLAVSLTIGQQPTTVKTRVAFNPVPTVVLRDVSGNQVTSENAATVTAQLKDSTGNPVGTESSPFTASAGLVTFTGLAFQAPSTANYYVTFKLVSNGQAVTSNAFDILPGLATELRITRQPSTDTIDRTPGKTGELLATQPIVKLYDQDGNLVTTANSGSVTVRVKSTDLAGDLSEGSVTANVTGGIATFSGVKFVGTPGVTYALDFSTATPNPTITSAASTAISVTHNDATHLVVSRPASGGRSGRAFTVQPIVAVKDRYENTVTTGPDSTADIRANGEITAPSAGVSNPSDDTATAIDGVATFGALGLTGLVSNTYKLNFNMVGRNTVAAVSQSNITITYGTANQLALTTQPLGGNATGQHLATQPVIEIRDGAGNKVASSSLTVTASIIGTSGLTLADGSSARLAGDTKAAVAGVASFDALDLYGLPGIDYTLRFTVTGLGYASAEPLQVIHAAAHHLTISTQPAGGNPTGANLSGQPVVQLRDAFENVVSSDSTDVLTARLSTASSRETLDGNITATFDHGVATFSGLKVIALPETNYTLDFTTTVGGSAITSAASTSFQITYATATKLAINQQPVAGTTGTQLTAQPIVEVQDFYGNRVRNFSGVVTALVGGTGVTLTNSSYIGGGNSLEMAVVDGRATFTGLELTGVPATDYQLTFATNTLTSVNSGNIRVTPGTPVRIEIINQPIGAQTGSALAAQPVVKIVDSFGNTVTQNSNTVITAALTSGSGGTLTRVVSSNSVAITATTVNGVATFSNLYMRGLTTHDYRMTFTSGVLASAVSAPYQVSHAAITQLVWNTQPTADRTGSPLTRAAVLELQDLDGNIADTDSSTVVTAQVTTGVGASPLQNATAIADHGVVTFDTLTLTGTPGTAYKLTFTAVVGSTSFSAPESDGLVLAHAIPAKLTMRGGNVTGGLTGQDLTSQPTLYVRDRFNNIATTDNTTVVTAAIYNDQTGSVTGNVTARASNGEISFAGLKASGVPGTAYTLRFTGDWVGTNLTAVNSNTFTVSKRADVALAYAAQQYVPSAVVHPAFNTDSPGTVTYSTASPSAICSLNTSNGDILINGVGTCAVRVDVAATTYYLAHYAEASLVISKANQAPVTITSPANVNFWSTLTPAASGGTGTGAIFFSVNGTCRIVGTTLIPGDAGSLCQLSATRMGDANYLAASPDFQTITINKLAQSTLSIVAATEMTVGTLELFTAGGSGSGAVAFAVHAGDASRCSVSGSTLTAAASGNCRITARKAASTNYEDSNIATATIRVNLDVQNVAFTSTAPSFPVALGSYLPTAISTSSLSVTFSIVTSNTTPACAFDQADSRKVNFLTSGDCEIVATQAGSGRFAAATASQRIRVGVLNQTINFAAIADKTFGTPAFQLSASSNSGLNVSISTTSNSVACSISNLGLVTLNAAGLCELEATQAGNSTYAAATPVVRSFTVTADLAGAPHIFSASATTHAFTVAFTAPSYNGGASITAYALSVTDADGNVFVNAACPAGSSPITCTIVGISNDIAYTAVVKAITIAGMGSPSNASIPQTPADAPVAVTNLAAATTNNDLVVTWSPPTALDSTFSRYEIYVAPIGTDLPVSPSATETNPSSTGTTIANIVPVSPSLTPTAQSLRVARASSSISFRRASISTPTPSNSSTTVPSSAPAGYKVSVVTITQSSSSASSANTSSGVQTSFTTPLAPSRLTLDPVGTKLVISWSAPTSDGGSALSGYDVKVNGAVICGSTTLLACDFDGVSLGRTYLVEVTANNAVGSGVAARDSYSTAAPAAQAGSTGSTANSADSANGMAILSGSRKTASTKGGDILTLHTRNFAGVTGAWLDGKPLKIVSNSEDEITVVLPEHEAGSVDLIFRSDIGKLVYQNAITFVAPPRAAVSQTYSRYGIRAVAVNTRATASIRAVITANERPKAMVCVGLVPAQHSIAEVKLARARAEAICSVGSKFEGNLVVRATTGVTKKTGAAARTVLVNFTY